MSRLLGVEEALALVLARVPPPVEAQEPIDIGFAIGCTLFEDVHADADHPAWPRSRVDGYAVRAADAPGRLEVGCEVAAGRAPGDSVAPGRCARIFTGAPVPEGADAVVKQEDVRAEAGHVVLSQRVERGHNVTPQGAEARAGSVVARKGDAITPAVVGVLASVGRASVRVARRPSVAIVSTGSELVPVTETPAPGRIRNSNAPSLMAAMWNYGGWPEVAGLVPDERPALDDAVGAALAKESAVLLLTGGVSVGAYDFVPAVLGDAGVERVFHGVNVQPGKPLWFGTRGTTLVFGLPGNPVSALVNATLFVRPAIRAMSGRRDPAPETIRALLGGPLGGGAERRRYVPARLTHSPEGRAVATPVPFAGSGDVFGFAGADALVVVPEHAPARRAGEEADAVPLGWGGR